MVIDEQLVWKSFRECTNVLQKLVEKLVDISVNIALITYFSLSDKKSIGISVNIVVITHFFSRNKKAKLTEFYISVLNVIKGNLLTYFITEVHVFVSNKQQTLRSSIHSSIMHN